MLEIHNLSKRFGGLKAVEELILSVEEKKIVGLVGPNGAGKSTLLNMITGVIQPNKGSVFFRGEEVTYFSPNKRAEKGIVQVFQRNLLFYSFSVLDNVIAGVQLRYKNSIPELFYKTPGFLNRKKIIYEKAEEILGYLGISNHKNELAVNLPHGKQRVLCLAVALATNPDLIVLDEPFAGMNQEETKYMIFKIKALREEKGITCILVEHNFKAILEMCDKVVVMNYGKKIAEGPPSEIVEKPEVIEAYLGVKQNAF